MGETFELSVDTWIDAPADVVWAAMIDGFAEWFCPAPWRAEAREVEWRPGGRFLVAMLGPDGEEVLTDGVVLEWEAGRRFVFTDAFTVGWVPAAASSVAVFEIGGVGERTLYRAVARHWTRDAMERHRAMGFEAGWGAAAAQLRALAEARFASGASVPGFG